MKGFFVALSVLLLALVGIAAASDTASRQYLSIQDQYQKDYNTTDFDVSVQQLFPSFPEATVGSTFRVERCISCHVPDIGTIGPVQATQRLSQDFFKYEPNAKQIAAEYHLTGTHPAYITSAGGNYPASISYAQYGADGFQSYTYIDQNHKTQTAQLPGFIPSFLNPVTSSQGTGQIGIDQIGCIVCHNGGRLALDETDAHQNLIINPEYSFTEGAALYYKNCAQCHGGQGQGGIGPPLNNQDRLGFYNEDYYYRCIEWGFTDFEHYGSVMPDWGGPAPGYQYDAARDKEQPLPRALTDQQIAILIQFIRHWEQYSTLP
ncbi:MAG: cytochrome c [Candidatus Dormibacteraeota bacterium]|nr:cytochrome c [Candidatus Dormibacteraeota bacterium]